MKKSHTFTLGFVVILVLAYEKLQNAELPASHFHTHSRLGGHRWGQGLVDSEALVKP